ncbi:LysE family translocator [Sagittula sp. S175]|uniref:LysE family translocator n=1 Tax=Sagittula sp. S175 TaxID=3415129 RepID=UPI003C7C0981
MSLIVPLVLFLFPLAYSPGPGNLTFAANGARFGFAATLPASLGYHLATWIVTVAVGFGAVALLQALPGIFTVLKLTGTAYVLLLATRFLRAGITEDETAARPIGFGDGAVLLVLNPKAYVIIALMFTQFLGTAGNAALILLIATVFTLNNLLAFSLWTLAGDVLLRGFRTPTHARRINLAFGAALALTALWMLSA